MPKICACCGYKTVAGNHSVCPVCFWQNDSVQNSTPSYAGGANTMSLESAKENYERYGAVLPKFVANVRAPLPEEVVKK